MVKRRIGSSYLGFDGGQYTDPEDIKSLLQLANVNALSNTEMPLVEDLAGSSQEPKDFRDPSVPPQQFEDIRHNQVQPSDDFVENLQNISQLPMAMSENEDLIQDAKENLNSYQQAPKSEKPLQSQNKHVQMNPNDVMKQLSSLAWLDDDDRVDYLGNMQQQADDKVGISLNNAAIPPKKEGKIQDPLEFIRSRVAEDPSLFDLLPKETQDLLKGSQSQPEKPFVPEPTQINQNEQPIIPKDQEITKDNVDKYENKQLQPEAVEKGSQDPQIMADLARLNGLQKIPPEQLEQAAQWQNALTKRREELTDDELVKLDKANNGELSTMDKTILGIAIAIPVLIALRYGAVPGLLSAGEGLKAFGTSISQQEKQKKEAQGEATKQRKANAKELFDLEEKSIEVNKKLLDSIPDQKAREFIKDKKIIRIGDKIGISTGDEKDALWFDGNQLETSEDGIKQSRKYLDEAKEKLGFLNKAGVVIDDVLDVLDALPKDTGVWEAIKSNFGWFTSGAGKNPFGGSPVMIDVKDKNGNVRKVNGFELLKQKMTALQDVYNRVNLQRAALTSNVLEHWSGILGDPKSLNEWFTGQDLQTVKDKTQSLKDFLNEGVIEQLVGNGFLRQPLERHYQSGTTKPLQAGENVVNQIRANPEAYRSKVT